MRLLPMFGLGSAAFFGLLCLHFAGDGPDQRPTTRPPAVPVTETAAAAAPAAADPVAATPAQAPAAPESAPPAASAVSNIPWLDTSPSRNAAVGVTPQSPDPIGNVDPYVARASQIDREATLPIRGYSRGRLRLEEPIPAVAAGNPVVADAPTARARYDVSATVESVLAAPLRTIRIPTRRRFLSRAGPRPGDSLKVPFTVSVRVLPSTQQYGAAPLVADAELTLDRGGGVKTEYRVRINRRTGAVTVLRGEKWLAAADWLKDFDARTG